MKQFRVIAIPIHQEDKKVPISVVHIPISKGRYATLQAPLAEKTMTALLGTLEACKDSLIAKSK